LEKLEVIQKILEEHISFRENIKLAGDSVSDPEALAGLMQARGDWTPGQADVTPAGQEKLQGTLSYIAEGLQNHFAFEEELLPPVLGEVLTRGLKLEHSKIRAEIDAAKSTIAGTSLDGLSRDELLSAQARVKQLIDNIGQIVERHAADEEALLRFAEIAIREGERGDKG
jgi:hemerythrin